ncbi:MAG: helix-turn-helix domain-containing protein [Bauldia sp.]
MSEPSVRLIAELVAAHFRLEYREVLSNRRDAPIVHARHVAMYLAKLLTSQSLADIGRRLSRDHTTVMHGSRQIERAVKEDADLAEELTGIEVAIRAVTAASLRVPVAPTTDHDPLRVAERILNAPNGPTSISIDELMALATAVTAAHDEGVPELAHVPVPPPPAPLTTSIVQAANELLLALVASEEASVANRGSIIAARHRLTRARGRMAAALHAINSPTRQEKKHAVHTAHG